MAIGQTSFMARRRSQRVTLQDRTVVRNSATATQPTVFWRLASTGIVQFPSGPSGALTNGETWLLSGLNSDYEVRFTNQGSDTTVSGVTFGTWLACSTTREVDMTAPTQDNVDYAATILVEIRDKVTLAVLATCTVSLSTTWSTV